MKPRIVVISATLAVASLSACGGHSEPAGSPTPPSPPMSQQQSLDTEGVADLARSTSETGTAFAVNEGALRITDTSETTEPVSLNGM
jgi:hypothetical protein